MIPKTLYHIWLGSKEESPLAKECLASWKLLTEQGYELKEINSQNYPKGVPFVDKALAKAEATHRATYFVKANDYLRVWLLYNFGGIYMDNDVEVLKSFDPLLSYGCFLGAEASNLVNMAVLGAEKGNWFLGECLKEYEKFKGDDSTPPVIFSLYTITDILRRYGWEGNKELDIKDVKVFSNKQFYPYHWAEGEPKGKITTETHPDAFAVHHWGRSWTDI